MARRSRYADADRVTLVCDQLNTHVLGSLYKTFPADEALRIANRIELVQHPQTRLVAEYGRV